MTTYYHVAHESYQMGEDIKCWHALVNEGSMTADDWKWDEAPVGYDGDLISLYCDREDAQDYMSEFGGTLLVVDCDGLDIRRNAEGFECIRWEIPADRITWRDG